MKQYIIDAFTDEIFLGNQAAICVMDDWPSEKLMMNIARENNFSETAFCVREKENYKLRWFTPGGEIDLCGHATLAAAFVIANFYEDTDRIIFDTMSGLLCVKKNANLFAMDFPAYKLEPVKVSEKICNALGVKPERAFMGRDLLCVLESESQVRACKPDMQKVKELDGLLLHITARGQETKADCVSRSFAPKLGIIEDPVCGSGHCHIVPHWSHELGKKNITAFQASERGGWLYCENADERVILSGNAVLFSRAEIAI